MSDERDEREEKEMREMRKRCDEIKDGRWAIEMGWRDESEMRDWQSDEEDDERDAAEAEGAICACEQ